MGLECFLCLSQQEDISGLQGHLASFHQVLHEANVLLLLQVCGKEERQRISTGLMMQVTLVYFLNCSGILISTFRLRRPPGCGRRRERPSDKVNIVDNAR